MTTMLVELAAASMAGFTLVVFAVQFAARELGCWLAARRLARGDAPSEGVGVVVAGMLGLLGFVLALTLSFANTRYQERRDATLAEANAIGTAWLRAEAIDHPRSAEIARLLVDYTKLRADFVRVGLDAAAIEELNRRSNAAQSVIWGHMAGLVRERPDPIIAALQASLNDTFDSATSQRFAFAARLPPQLAWLLLGMATLGMAGLGYQLGQRGRPLRVLSTLLVAMWTAILVVILDLGSARIGNIRTSTAVYDWTVQGFEGGVSVPALPASR
ncbi:hypothetical protein [Roseomonas sp. CECT 9278]|uniref:hypothetical protein n=1 Tax=Roseomonas sp. CECT 9278 TaxID=2845823 RepID=UPI001E647C72|nr:hypothetical protein [Roseomonas sp. CECT 9278]CAH0248351.1 hypothetical protein ROS9278_03077 [Roseomonas sp. CECT 9278]